MKAMALITALSGSGILAILLIYDLLTFRVGKLFLVFVCNTRQLLQTIYPLLELVHPKKAILVGLCFAFLENAQKLPWANSEHSPIYR